MRPRFLLVTLPLALLSPLAAQDAELQLKQTLAKIVFAHEVNVITSLGHRSLHHETPTELQQALAKESLDFAVTDFSSGSAHQIINRPLAELVRWLPDNRTLYVGVNPMHGMDENGATSDEMQAEVAWGSSVNTPPKLATYTLEGMAKAGPAYAEYASCTTYINPTIKATYKGEMAEFKALYLFGCGSKQEMLAVDPVMGDAVPQFWNASVYPSSLLVGIGGRVPAVQEWLKTHASTTCAGTQTCYENGTVVIPKEKIPAPIPQRGLLQPPSTSDGLGCSDYGFDRFHGDTTASPDDHYNGNHHWAGSVDPNCSYWGTNGNDASPCYSEASVTSSSIPFESGITNYFHEAYAEKDSEFQDASPHQTSGASGGTAMEVDYCLLPGCVISSLSVKGGVGAGNLNVTINFTPSARFKWHDSGSALCAPQTGGPGGSPLVIDLQNTGWHFVKPSVPFDMNVTGTPQVSAWPDATYGVAFLALPNHGQITSGLQLFGNHTPQPACPGNWPHCQNGFRALAVYDDNSDGVIDKRDKIWPYLRLWVDHNMNGKVDGGELMTLNAAGITSISLKYQPTMTHVAWGTLRYESTLVGLPDKRIFDVFLSQTK